MFKDGSNDSHITCEFTHLTSFAALFRFTDVSEILFLITSRCKDHKPGVSITFYAWFRLNPRVENKEIKIV